VNFVCLDNNRSTDFVRSTQRAARETFDRPQVIQSSGVFINCLAHCSAFLVREGIEVDNVASPLKRDCVKWFIAAVYVP
jgi:hypothetical protein